MGEWRGVSNANEPQIIVIIVFKELKRATVKYLLRLVLVDKVLPLAIRCVLPHLRDYLGHLPQLQLGIGRLHLVPHLAAVPHERHQRLLWGLRWLRRTGIDGL